MGDTETEAHRVHIELMRRAPGWRKLQLAAQLHQSLRMLALAGLRERHPGASAEELRRRYDDVFEPTRAPRDAAGGGPEPARRGMAFATTLAGATTLDVGTVIKAAQAVAGEIELESLLSRLMRIVIENAGHWVHHDQLDEFIGIVREFFAEP